MRHLPCGAERFATAISVHCSCLSFEMISEPSRTGFLSSIGMLSRTKPPKSSQRAAVPCSETSSQSEKRNLTVEKDKTAVPQIESSAMPKGLEPLHLPGRETSTRAVVGSFRELRGSLTPSTSVPFLTV